MDTEAVALIVDEPIAGHFYWVLQKQDGRDCRPVDAAEGPMPTYGAAMMAGIAALQRRAERHWPGADKAPLAGNFTPSIDRLGPPTIH